jgi:hypothetical protein
MTLKQMENPEGRVAESSQDLSSVEKGTFGEKKKNIDVLVSLAQTQIRQSQQSAEEVDRLVHERNTLLEDYIARIEADNKEGVYAPLYGIEVTDYAKLCEAGILSDEERIRLESVDTTMETYKDFLAQGDMSKEMMQTMEELGNARLDIRADLSSEIETRREELADEFHDIESRLKDIEQNQGVIDRLRDIAREDMDAYFATQEKEKLDAEEKARIDAQEKERLVQETIQKAGASVTSLAMRHENTFTSIASQLSNPALAEEIHALVADTNMEHVRRVLNSVREGLIRVIMESEDKNHLKDPSQIVPWRKHTDALPYTDTLNFLRNNDVRKTVKEHATNSESLVEQMDTVVRQNEILRALFGAQYVFDYTTKDKKQGKFWAAFSQRKENDQNGLTKQHKEERVQREEEMRALREQYDAIKQKGGFEVMVPSLEEKGKKFVPGIPHRGAVLLTARLNKKSVPIFDVVETVGAAKQYAGKTYTAENIPACISQALGTKGLEDLKKSLTKETKANPSEGATIAS